MRRYNKNGWREVYGLGLIRKVNLPHPFLNGNYWVKIHWTNEKKNKYDLFYHPGDLILAEEVLIETPNEKERV